MREDERPLLGPVRADRGGQQRRDDRAQGDADADDGVQMVGRTEVSLPECHTSPGDHIVSFWASLNVFQRSVTARSVRLQP
ncbi:hypothetical protein AB0K09_20650 [Streptomyces sp. NPDC049577]|uniref:hypothetical protein n=1 Tax=Streptomyces sp. NPDC049577 TaxID=3155153 RepID=UPI003412DD00